METTFTIRNRFGENLEALLKKPQARGCFPAVLFVSGFGMTMHEYKNSNDEISEMLVRHGFLTLQFSFAGCGGSQGDYREMTLERQGAQIEDSIAWIAASDQVDRRRIGIFAQSFGVPSCLNADLSLISSLCFNAGTFYPGKSLRRVFVEERGAVIIEGQDVKLPRSGGAMTVVGKQFFPDVDAFRVSDKIKRITQPVLVIHGDKDTKIPTSDVRRVFAVLPSRKKKLKIFKNGDHGILDVPRPMREEFLHLVADWFTKTL